MGPQPKGMRLFPNGRARSRLLTEVAAMSWIPKRSRLRLFRWAGCPIESAPGRNITFAGKHENLHIGAGTYMNRGVFLEAVAPVEIGARCHLGMECMILTSHHPIGTDGDWTFAAEGRAVNIGDRVWLGARAVILPGAVIESHVIVAAGAVVTGRCVTRGVYAGVPARRVKDLSTGPST